MSVLKNISFAGGDLRNVYMANYFATHGFDVYTYGLSHDLLNNCHNIFSIEELISTSRIVVFPIPVSKNGSQLNIGVHDNKVNIKMLPSLLTKKHIIFGGKFPNSIIKHCHDNEIPVYDFLKNESISVLNSIATAEGAIAKAIQLGDINLHKSKCLVLGYGKCGKTIAMKLKGLDAFVTVSARNPIQLSNAYTDGFNNLQLKHLKENINHFNFIFNTIPNCILTPSVLDNVNKNTIIIDIASYPGGVDFDYANSLNIKNELYLGIPGKISPKSSAEILCQDILQILDTTNSN